MGSRRSTIAVTAAAVLVVAALTAAAPRADGATGPRVATPATQTALPPTAYAVLPSGSHDALLVGGVNEGHLFLGEPIDYSVDTSIDGSAISASGTKVLVADDEPDVQQITRGATTTTHTLSLSHFDHELTPTSTADSQGVAVGPGFALVTVGEQGVVQLREKSSRYVVDSRVQSAGLDKLGDPHAPGFIAAGRPSDATYDGVAVSRVPLPNGSYRALIIDRDDSSLQVIDGVGTARPKLVGKPFKAAGLADLASDDGGTGGIAFSPATPTRALIATPSGVAALDLTHPAHPTLKQIATPLVVGVVSALAVAPNGRTFAFADGGTIIIYSGGLANTTTPTAASFQPSMTSGQVRSLAYTSNGLLLAEYDDVNGATSEPIGGLGIFSNLTATSPDFVTGSLAMQPFNNDAMTTFPLVATGTIRVASLAKHLKVGKKVHATLLVTAGIGHYSFKISKGSSPKGLTLHGHTISGTPKRAGTHHLKLTALNNYGGAVLGALIITVKKR
jgi:hypothetical protein